MNIVQGEFRTAARRAAHPVGWKGKAWRDLRDDEIEKNLSDKAVLEKLGDAGRPSRWADAIPGRVEDVLMAGGDGRLDLDPESGLNSYGCKLQPRNDEVSFSSSTASTISEQAFAAAGRAHRLLQQASVHVGSGVAVNHAIERLRRNLKEELGFADTDIGVVLSPSGTDSAIHALAIARCLMAGPPVSIIAASEETGSGIASAAAGRHPDRRTALGASVTKGQVIEGLGEGMDCIPLPCRDAQGRLLDAARGDLLLRTVIGRVVDTKRPVLLYAMDQSKLGSRMPGEGCLDTLASIHSGQPMVVVDACQGRVSRARIKWYLDKGFMVQITGSKFFGGPAFCGALLVPPHLSARMREVQKLPAGLKDYTSRCDWPADWESVRQALPETPNLGSWLRWVAALEEMRAYYAVPVFFRDQALGRFSWVVSELIRRDPDLELMTDPTGGLVAQRTPGSAPDEMEHRSILPFFIKEKGRPLSMSEAVKLHQALNRDLSRRLPPTASEAERTLAATPCHIGQPVAVPVPGFGLCGALRISADARLVSEAWRKGGEVQGTAHLELQFARAGLVLRKIRLARRLLDETPAKPQPLAATA